MIRVLEAITYSKKIALHRNDAALIYLAKDIEYLHSIFLAELAILKRAREICTSTSLYIGCLRGLAMHVGSSLEWLRKKKLTFQISVVSTWKIIQDLGEGGGFRKGG